MWNIDLYTWTDKCVIIVWKPRISYLEMNLTHLRREEQKTNSYNNSIRLAHSARPLPQNFTIIWLSQKIVLELSNIGKSCRDVRHAVKLAPGKKEFSIWDHFWRVQVLTLWVRDFFSLISSGVKRLRPKCSNEIDNQYNWSTKIYHYLKETSARDFERL